VFGEEIDKESHH